MKEYLYDPGHPLKSPILGIFVSNLVCRFGHDVVVAELDEWDEPWLTCSVCGARFFPASAIDEDTEVIRI